MTSTLPLRRWLPLTTWVLALGCMAMSPSALARDNPLLTPSTLPFQFPAFDRIQETDFREGFEKGMAEQLKEIAAIADNPAAPDFDNTIVALERSGATLNRVSTIFDNLTAVNANPEHDAIDAEMSPRRSAHADAISFNHRLFSRISALHERRASLGLDPESLHLLDRYYTTFVRAGAGLDNASQDRLKQLNQQLASVNTRYDQTLLKTTSDSAVVVNDVQELQGLSPERIAAAAQAAKDRKLDHGWVIPLQRPTSQDILADLDNRALRERVFKAAAGRGWTEPGSTTRLITELATLRARKARLLGYPDWASYVLADVSAQTPAAVNDMLGRIGPVALSSVKHTATRLQALIDAEAAAAGRPSFALEAWDWAYYSGKLARKEFAYDESAIRPYFELDHVLKDGVFFAASRLYGLTFKERHDLPVYQPDVRVFEVHDRDGSLICFMLFDFFARSNKQGGAWDNEYVSQSALLDTHPVIANHLNIAHPAPGQVALLNYDEARTMFHEFGHALHGLLSSVRYPMFGGTNNSPPDFVEFPSQFNEMWIRNPEVLANMARHYQTGAALPAGMLEKVDAAERFAQGFNTVEYVAAAMLDQAWHQIPESAVPTPDKAEAFERDALDRLGMGFAAVPPRYRSTYFSHIFGASSGYAAQYYGYLWSEVLARDTEDWMNRHGGLQRANGDFLRAKVLSRGSSADQRGLFREFYGAEPDPEPLLKFRGLTDKAPK